MYYFGESIEAFWHYYGESESIGLSLTYRFVYIWMSDILVPWTAILLASAADRELWSAIHGLPVVLRSFNVLVKWRSISSTSRGVKLRNWNARFGRHHIERGAVRGFQAISSREERCAFCRLAMMTVWSSIFCTRVQGATPNYTHMCLSSCREMSTWSYFQD